METLDAAPLVLDRGLLWHRFALTGSERDLVARINELSRVATEHGHEFSILQSLYDAVEENEQAARRAADVRTQRASSFAAAGFKERHVYVPIVAFGMFEGDIFDIFDAGIEAGVRLVFVGTQERFESLPWRMTQNIDASGRICGCSGGF